MSADGAGLQLCSGGTHSPFLTLCHTSSSPHAADAPSLASEAQLSRPRAVPVLTNRWHPILPFVATVAEGESGCETCLCIECEVTSSSPVAERGSLWWRFPHSCNWQRSKQGAASRLLYVSVSRCRRVPAGNSPP